MKLNNKGFMLVEIIIVSAIIVTSMVGLYSGFSNTYKAYEIKNSYYDVKTIYALKNFENFLLDEMILNNMNQDYVEYKHVDNPTTYQEQFINNFFETYVVEQLYLVKYKETSLNNFKSVMVNDSDLIDYLEFYVSSFDNPDYNKYNYILIAKVGKISYKDNEGNDKVKEIIPKYSALRIK